MSFNKHLDGSVCFSPGCTLAHFVPGDVGHDLEVAGGQLAEAVQRQEMQRASSMLTNRDGWTDENWIADARFLMNEPDGAITSLVNGHVMALLRFHQEVMKRSEEDAAICHDAPPGECSCEPGN